MPSIKSTYTLMIILSCLVGRNISAVYSEEEKSALIINLEVKINYAFDKLSEAEEEGADVQELAIELNEANTLLSKTKKYLDDGKSTEASLTAQECERKCTQIAEEANSLAASAVQQDMIQTRNRLLTSFVAIIGIVIASIFSWRKFRQHYLKRALTRKPEVYHNET